MITAERPDVKATALYTSKEAGRALGVAQGTLRKYRKMGVLKFSVRKADNRIVYRGSAIVACWEEMYL